MATALTAREAEFTLLRHQKMQEGGGRKFPSKACSFFYLPNLILYKVKFSSSLKLRIASFLLGVLGIVTAFLSRREDSAPSLSRMYIPPQVYYAQEYLVASGLMLVSALILFILSFKKNQKK